MPSRAWNQMVEEGGAARPAAASGRACCSSFACYGWVRVWGTVTLSQIITYFGTSAGVKFIIDDAMLELGLTRSEMSLAYTVGTLIGAVVQLPIGRFVDRHGGRRGVTATSALYGVSVAAMCLPRDWITLTLAFCALRAFGFGGLLLSSQVVLAQWFERRRGLATGMANAVSSFLGFGLLSSLLTWIVAVQGWRRGYLLVGLCLLAHSPLAALALISRPEEIGMRPDGQEQVEEPAAARDGGDTPAKLGAPSPAGAAADGSWTLHEARRTLSFHLLLLSNAVGWGVGAGYFFHFASISAEAGLPLEKVSTCYYLPWAVARSISILCAGAALDRFAPRAMLFAGLLGAAVALAALGWPGATLSCGRASAIGVLHGASMGTSTAVFQVCPASFFGRAHLGAIQGVAATTNVAATAIGPLIFGTLHDALGSYSPILLGIALLTVRGRLEQPAPTPAPALRL
jgi:MFS family permease